MKNDFLFRDAFTDNPWENCKRNTFPAYGHLYFSKDPRFTVSIKGNSSFVFCVKCPKFIPIKSFSDLSFDSITCYLLETESANMIVCQLENSDFFEEFKLLAKDMAAHLCKCSDIEIPKRYRERMLSWREFFKPVRTGLGFEKLIGFYSELRFFRDFLLPKLGAYESLESWFGIQKKPQDFVTSNTAFEIKCMFSREKNMINIQSLDQLDTATKSIFLIVYSGHIGDKGDETLKEVYESTIADMSEEEKLYFLRHTSPYYTKASIEEINQKLFLGAPVIYSVGKKFPALTRQNVDKRIKQVSYKLSLDQLTSFKVDKEILDLL
ncbi:hypothetical protein MTsDn1_18330 [Alteromonas sp. MTD1]|uniref:PD-(D/E)XK motif protein n=1 Tax=Alteromonas sp. MTD1 TaxID=3057962 RepID=UPI0036F2ABB3